MKTCKDCGSSKLISEFYPTSYRSKRNSDIRLTNYQPYCKPCHGVRSKQSYNKDRHRMLGAIKLVGITEDEYWRLLADQGHVCAICEKDLTPPYIDHDHVTGKFRGFLCLQCNTVLGLMNENPEWLRKAAGYIDGRRTHKASR